jgi:hypothetical protein
MTKTKTPGPSVGLTAIVQWHKYEGLLPTKEFDNILAEIDRDPTGIFWG